MSYNYKQIGFVPITVTVTDLTSASSQQRFLAVSDCLLKEVAINVQTATVSTGNIVVKPKKRVVPNSDVGGTDGSTVIIPTAIAAGVGYYKAQTLSFKKGDELCFEVTTASAGGSAAGAAWCFPSEVEESPETNANDSTLVASA